MSLLVSDAAATPRLVDLVWPRGRAGAWGRGLALAILGSLLLWVSAKVQVPFWPVPMTLQTGVVLLLGVAYGWRLAAATVLLYLIQGAMGLPVFAGTPAKGIGIAYMAGPTGGYLAGFIAAAAIAGWGVQTLRSPISRAASLVAAMLVIYACGAAWLSLYIGFAKAIEFGILPFVLGDAIKIALVAVLCEAGLRQLGRRSAG